ncbi:hypothetical protein HDU97_002600 [Phlyctochytrium planicorne]|nr:hypothetical protein HDU97_002600 [Phlyctochytrium planicorne]
MEDRLILIAKGSTLKKTDRVVQAALKIAPIVAYAPEEAPSLVESLQSIGVVKKDFKPNVSAPEFIPESEAKEDAAEVRPKFARMFAELCAKSSLWFEYPARFCEEENWDVTKKWRYRATD